MLDINFFSMKVLLTVFKREILKKKLVVAFSIAAEAEYFIICMFLVTKLFNELTPSGMVQE